MACKSDSCSSILTELCGYRPLGIKLSHTLKLSTSGLWNKTLQWCPTLRERPGWGHAQLVISQKLRLVTKFQLLLHFPCFFYSRLNIAGVARIVLNYYDQGRILEKRACNSPRAKTEWAEECYWKSRFLLNRVLQRYR